MSLGIVRPDGIDTDNANWTASAGTKYGAVSDQLDSTFISSSSPNQRILFTLGNLAVAGNAVIEKLEIIGRWYIAIDGSAGMSLKHAGATVDQTLATLTESATAVYVEQRWDVTLLRPGGGVWVIDDLNNFAAGIAGTNWSTIQPNCTEIRVEATYDDVPSQLAGPREAASRILRRRLVLEPIARGQVPLEALARGLYSDFGLVHRDAPTADGLGYRLAKWARGLYRLTAMEWDMETDDVSIEAESLRHYLVNYWDVGKANASGPFYDGVAMLDGGQLRTFNRDTPAWVEDPDGVVSVVQFDIEAIDKIGRIFEGAGQNFIKRSSFIDGLTGWTSLGTGYNSSAITAVNYEGRGPSITFDSKVTTKLIRFDTWTTGTPAPAALRIESSTSDSMPANTRGRVSIDYRPASGEAMAWWARRNFDNFWWNDSTGAWQSTEVANALSGAVVTRQRAISKVIDVGTNASTLTFWVGFPAAAANGKTGWAMHCQWEDLPFATSRIVTGSAAFTRLAATLNLSNNSSNRIWPISEGTLTFRCKSWWATADLAAGAVPTLWYAFHDSNNYDWIYYDKDNSRFVFERKVAGTVYRAVISHTQVREQEAALACRWVSDQGQLGLPNWTASIFKAGVKGTDVTTGAAPTQVASANLYEGAKNGASWWNGSIYDVELVPFALRDEEILRRAL